MYIYALFAFMKINVPTDITIKTCQPPHCPPMGSLYEPFQNEIRTTNIKTILILTILRL